jgi:hypothetical protein
LVSVLEPVVVFVTDVAVAEVVTVVGVMAGPVVVIEPLADPVDVVSFVAVVFVAG